MAAIDPYRGCLSHHPGVEVDEEAQPDHDVCWPALAAGTEAQHILTHRFGEADVDVARAVLRAGADDRRLLGLPCRNLAGSPGIGASDLDVRWPADHPRRTRRWSSSNRPSPRSLCWRSSAPVEVVLHLGRARRGHDQRAQRHGDAPAAPSPTPCPHRMILASRHVWMASARRNTPWRLEPAVQTTHLGESLVEVIGPRSTF